MADETGIAWCDSTINLWIGCTKVSPGCDNCYAEKLGRRFGVEWDGERKRTGEASWGKIAAYQRGAARFRKKHGHDRRVFINSLSDFFDNQVEQSWRDRACADFEQAPDVIFILVTKRPQNVTKMVPKHWLNGYWPKNVWLLTTAENQQEYDRRVAWLLSIPGPDVVGISMEPMIGDIHPGWSISYNARERAEWASRQIKRHVPDADVNKIRWVIIGGESGRGARPMPSDDEILRTMQRMSSPWTAFFMKQRSQAQFPDTFKDYATFPRFLQHRSFPA